MPHSNFRLRPLYIPSVMNQLCLRCFMKPRSQLSFIYCIRYYCYIDYFVYVHFTDNLFRTVTRSILFVFKLRMFTCSVWWCVSRIINHAAIRLCEKRNKKKKKNRNKKILKKCPYRIHAAYSFASPIHTSRSFHMLSSCVCYVSRKLVVLTGRHVWCSIPYKKAKIEFFPRVDCPGDVSLLSLLSVFIL